MACFAAGKVLSALYFSPFSALLQVYTYLLAVLP